MPSILEELCEELAKRREDLRRKEFEELIVQFVRSDPLNSESLSSFQRDPHLVELFSYLFIPILSLMKNLAKIQAIPPNIYEIIKFIDRIPKEAPSIAGLLSVQAPIDQMVSLMCSNIPAMTSQRGDPPQWFKPLTSLISNLSLFGPISINSSETFYRVIQIFEALSKSANTASFPLFLLCGFVKNCPPTINFLRTRPIFGTLKQTLASFLSNSDQTIVLCALCLLVMIFPQEVTPSVSTKAAVSALSKPSRCEASRFFAAWIITELSEISPLSSDDIWSLLQTSMKANLHSICIFDLLSSLTGLKSLIIDVFQAMNCLFLFISSIISSENGMVSVVGCQFLFSIFSAEDKIYFSPEVVDPFTQAIKIVLSPKRFIQLEKKEAALLITRFLLRSKEAFVMDSLVSNEQKLFLDFQREISEGNSFLSVEYFLLIYEGSRFLPEWKDRLSYIVLESQFSALLSHVLNQSYNRDSISDAIKCISLISGELTDSTPLVGGMAIDGQLIVNAQRRDAEESKRQEYHRMNQSLMALLKEMKVSKDCAENELSALQLCSQKESDQSKEMEMKRPNIGAKNVHLKETLSNLKSEEDAINASLKKAKMEHKSATDELNSIQRERTMFAIKEADNRAKVASIERIQREVEQIEADNRRIEKQIQIQKQVENKTIIAIKELEERQKKLATILVDKQNESKDLALNLDQMKDTNEILRKRNIEAEMNMKSLQSKVQIEESDQDSKEKEISALKMQIELVRGEAADASVKSGLKSQSLENLKAEIADLEVAKDERRLLIQLVRRTTENSASLPSSISSFISNR